jgi:hypothetical protein
MEYVDSVDLYRLLRRAETESRPIPPALAVHIRGVAAALGAVPRHAEPTASRS